MCGRQKTKSARRGEGHPQRRATQEPTVPGSPFDHCPLATDPDHRHQDRRTQHLAYPRNIGTACNCSTASTSLNQHPRSPGRREKLPRASGRRPAAAEIPQHSNIEGPIGLDV
jgi:hypothetical protein